METQLMQQMSGQKYKRTNFEEDDNTSGGGSPPGVIYDPTVAFKAGATFCQKRSTLEKFLLFLVLVFSIVVVILAAVLGLKHDEVTKLKKEQTLCTTPACVTVASSIINAMDLTVDPCDDFYKFACQGWVKMHPLPSGLSRWGTFGVMWKENQIVMKHILEQPINSSLPEAEKKAVQYYQSCMDANDTIQHLGRAPLIDLLKEFDGWNISTLSGEWDVSTWNFQRVLEKVHSYHLDNFFNVYISEDEKNSSVNILQVDQSGLVLVRDQYLNKSIREDENLKAYLKYMTTIGVLLGGEQNDTEQQMYEVIEFEQQLANITVPAEERRDDMKLYKKMKLSDLQDLAPFINWLDYTNNLLEVSGYTVKADEPIVVFADNYLHEVSELVTSLLETDRGKNTLHNYMIWHIVQSLVTYLSKPFRDAKKDFLQVLSGVKGGEEKWRYCTTDTDSKIGFALGAMFVRETFHGDSREKAELMIQDIKGAFKRNLPRLKWMDADVRQKAVEKANAVIDMIGFPAYILNASRLDAHYREFEVNPDEYFLNNVRNMKYVVKQNIDKLRKPPDKSSWSMTPMTVNAYYTPTKNEIVFPAGILQAPFYDRNYPKSLNFGAMGVVMGHELTHGFDDQGRKYDKNGILRPWWNEASVKNFQEQAKCMVNQYSKFTLNGEHVNGITTLGENIADNGGLKAAYYAYEDWLEKHGGELPLPGVNLTHRQLFFVAFSQVWCTTSTKQADHLTIINDPHSPNKFRVIGTLSNSQEFAQQFKCPHGSKMNPKDKCVVW